MLWKEKLDRNITNSQIKNAMFVIVDSAVNSKWHLLKVQLASFPTDKNVPKTTIATTEAETTVVDQFGRLETLSPSSDLTYHVQLEKIATGKFSDLSGSLWTSEERKA
jgi:hypothetical protein